LVKGGKWTWGWVVVGQDRTLPIPPDAWREYGFREGEEAIFLPGSRRSGGFSISTPGLVADAHERMGGAGPRTLGRSQFSDGQRVTLPPQIAVLRGARLLTVRGSCYGLGFIARGPIYAEALKHPDLQVFDGSD
jgi:hypothetical protein